MVEKLTNNWWKDVKKYEKSMKIEDNEWKNDEDLHISIEKMVKNMKMWWILRTMNEKLTNKRRKNSEKYEKAMKMARGNYFVTFKIFILDVR
jgi:hypothetical protein